MINRAFFDWRPPPGTVLNWQLLLHFLHDLLERTCLLHIRSYFLPVRAADHILIEPRAQAAGAKQLNVILLVAGLALAILLGFMIGGAVQRPNDRLRTSVEELAKGKVDAPIPHLEYPNEIGVMARAIGVLQGVSRAANEQHWVKSQIADISSVVQQAKDFVGLAQGVVSKVAPAIGAGHGVFYVADAQGSLNLLASYGFRERKHLNNSFKIGEGLVGQCAMEKTPITLTTPQSYIRINSGLGEGPPACVTVLPIIHDGRVLGVLELASFQQFTARETAMLDALMPTLATSMEIMSRNLRTQELLTATQAQAERMEKQAAQLEEQTVEMEAQQAELRETESWFRSIIETAPDGMMVADAAGKLLLANPNAEQLFGYAPQELVGLNLAKIVPALNLSPEQNIKAQVVAGQHKDGRSLALTLSASPLPDLGGRGRCFSVAVRANA
jgi:PAS domain S-box-containing protein